MRRALLAFGLTMVILVGTTPAAPSDVAAVRALRIENNRAIRAHDVSRMQKLWSSHIRLIETDGTVISGSRTLAARYTQSAFKDGSFVSYVRIPKSVVISSEGARAAEYGTWTAIYKAPKQIRSGNYFASWQKTSNRWKIVYEAYVSLGLEPQSVADVLKPTATITLRGTPDWLVVTPDSVWVSNGALKTVQRIDVSTSRLVATVRTPGEPCSGLAFGFGSVWVPLCEAHPSLARVDPRTNAVVALLPIAPALSEGGITTSDDSVWMATADGTLARIDPKTNRIRQTISITRGSFNPLFSNRTIWVTSGEKDVVTALDASNGRSLAVIPVGSKPRFLTAGGGMLWTLNQGDGSISQVDVKSKRLIATIAASIPGGGGDITYGSGAVWASIFGVPLTRVDAKCGIVRHWGGRGGDAVRFGHNAIWLTDYFNGRLWRIPAAKTRKSCEASWK